MADGPGHIAFLQSLPAETRAALSERRNRAGLVHLGGHGGAIACTAALIVAQVPGWWLLMPVQGVLLVFLFTLEHEATHKTPFASPALNELAGHLCGLILILPFGWFRYFHLAHHRWTNLPGRDPELAAPKPGTRAAWEWHATGLPYWRSALGTLWRLARGHADDAFLPDGARARVVGEARVMVLVYALGLASLACSPLLLWLWLVPV
ncbi:MAG: fatty acid desaturase, partial [Paracoccaceae bacterium]